MAGPYRGPSVPHRTARSRALEFSSADKFGEGNIMGGRYVPQAGYPSMPNLPPPDLYEEMEEYIQDIGPSQGVTPFKLGGM